MEYEVGGYPSNPDGVSPEIFRLAIVAGRQFEEKDLLDSEVKKYIYSESIEGLEQKISMAKPALEAARDPDISISSSNPYQSVQIPVGHEFERLGIQNKANRAAAQLSSLRAFIHQYVLEKHYELKFSGIADDVFSRIRQRVDSSIGATVPEAVKKLSAAYENLRSTNAEDWSNAVHSCRRILQDLADIVCPPQEDKVVDKDGESRIIKMGKDNYINRIMTFVESKSKSKRFQEIVGSQLSFLGDRLDSVFSATQKGSHSVIVSQEEADRYVVYTYLIVGDVLSLIV